MTNGMTYNCHFLWVLWHFFSEMIHRLAVCWTDSFDTLSSWLENVCARNLRGSHQPSQHNRLFRGSWSFDRTNSVFRPEKVRETSCNGCFEQGEIDMKCRVSWKLPESFYCLWLLLLKISTSFSSRLLKRFHTFFQAFYDYSFFLECLLTVSIVRRRQTKPFEIFFEHNKLKLNVMWKGLKIKVRKRNFHSFTFSVEILGVKCYRMFSRERLSAISRKKD